MVVTEEIVATICFCNYSFSPKGAGNAEFGSVTGYKFKQGVDVDLGGSGKTYTDALDDAFAKTGTPKSDFEVTK